MKHFCSSSDAALMGQKSPIHMHQVHSDVVDVLEDGMGPFQDGVITQRRDVALVIRHADCQPIVLYDPGREVLGAVHAGWRGMVSGIVQVAVRKMESRFGSDPSRLEVHIGPSLCPNHAEFKNFLTEFPPAFHPFQIRPHYFDLWAITKMQLVEAGVHLHNIRVERVCTLCGSGNFFSFRRDKTKERNVTVAFLG
ncbi:MAG: hypothetical protein A3F09_00145 [Chlamydiae bacterium RIFCSPHIGHO2_12_FULL_49_11]|nr:MAG: hypothetical protein A3F09_00145 [Chlamydiae bacterium RIFCSPHIGHO2_12_FULL_49_11]